MPDAAVFQRYADGFAAVAEALAGITPPELDLRPGPGCWTAREVVHHLADSETRSYLRLRTLLADKDGFIEPYDEAAWAAEPRLAYRSRPIEPSLAVLDAVRRSSLQLVLTLGEADFARAGHHPEHPVPYTLSVWLELYADHPHLHAAQIRRARRGEA